MNWHPLYLYSHTWPFNKWAKVGGKEEFKLRLWKAILRFLLRIIISLYSDNNLLANAFIVKKKKKVNRFWLITQILGATW